MLRNDTRRWQVANPHPLVSLYLPRALNLALQVPLKLALQACQPLLVQRPTSWRILPKTTLKRPRGDMHAAEHSTAYTEQFVRTPGCAMGAPEGYAI